MNFHSGPATRRPEATPTYNPLSVDFEKGKTGL